MDVYTIENKTAGTIDLPGEMFDIKWNDSLVHQAVTAQAANARHPIAHAKGRGEVRGGGKKPWRQKGTGRARHGSIRSPIWKGGGVTHGPTNERDFTKKLNKKMVRKALFIILSQKVRDGEFTIIDSLDIKEPKTKRLNEVLKTFFGTDRISALFIPRHGSENIFRAVRNIPSVKGIGAENLNVRDTLAFRRIFIDRSVVEELSKKETE